MTSMAPPPRFDVDPTQPTLLVEVVGRALGQADVSGVTLNLTAVRYGDPPLLAALHDLAEAARRCGKAITLEGVDPTLYKALHIAKLAELFSRAPSPAT
jgi:anti-anti-sigma regulatory factor